MQKSKNRIDLEGPLLDTVSIKQSLYVDPKSYPFSLNIIKNFQKIKFSNQVTFFVGENGTGKSTLLEAIAFQAGFGPEGGSKNIYFKTSNEKNYKGIELLAHQLILSWRLKPQDGYFFRAESFFNIANYLDNMATTGGEGAERTYAAYGGKSLHEQSHGESFLAFFKNRLGSGGFFILDEPEAALSPQRQLTLLIIINEMCKSSPKTQFIIATHSPLILAYPKATIYSCDSETLTPITYQETKHFQITKQFLNNPDYYMHHLFQE